MENDIDGLAEISIDVAVIISCFFLNLFLGRNPSNLLANNPHHSEWLIQRLL